MRADAIMRAPLPPRSLTRLQIKRELDARGLWAGFQAALADEPDMQEEWGLANEILRSDPMTVAMAVAMGFDEAATDAFFRAAASRTMA